MGIGPCKNKTLPDADKRVNCRFPGFQGVNMRVGVDVIPRGLTLAGGLELKDEVVSCCDYESDKGKVSVGDIGSVIGPCKNTTLPDADKRVNCRFPGFQGVNMRVGRDVKKVPS